MVAYQGGKFRLAKRILQQIGWVGDRPYVEPFVGAGHVIQHANAPRRIGADINGYMIALLEATRDGWEAPAVVTEEQYAAIKADPGAYDPALVGFVGAACSFGGRWFKGYARNPLKDYPGMGARSVAKQAPLLRCVEFTHCDYSDLSIPDGALVYCDPPYAGAGQGYKGGKFDSAAFWCWARRLVLSGHDVWVSEYTAPDDFRVVWEAQTVTTLPAANKARTERLFRHVSQV